jgi:uncharacterized membrane protein YidH (DUF202 family)
MNALKVVAILLIVAGGLALAYGGFSYTRESHRADIGSLHLKLDEKERVNIPVWAGIGSVVTGVVLLATSRKKAG